MRTDSPCSWILRLLVFVAISVSSFAGAQYSFTCDGSNVSGVLNGEVAAGCSSTDASFYGTLAPNRLFLRGTLNRFPDPGSDDYVFGEASMTVNDSFRVWGPRAAYLLVASTSQWIGAPEYPDAYAWLYLAGPDGGLLPAFDYPGTGPQNEDIVIWSIHEGQRLTLTGEARMTLAAWWSDYPHRPTLDDATLDASVLYLTVLDRDMVPVPRIVVKSDSRYQYNWTNGAVVPSREPSGWVYLATPVLTFAVIRVVRYKRTRDA